MRLRNTLCTIAFAVALTTASAKAQPLTNAFTYQGQLKQSGTPVSGLHDLRFRLYDAIAVGGVVVGPTVCINNVSVTDGLFTVSLDFGAQFAGQQRFLEIEVRTDTGLDCANVVGFTMLSPRQSLSAAPNSLFALNAGNATSATTATTATTATNATNATQLNGQAAAFYTNAGNLTGTLPGAALLGAYGNVLTLSNASNAYTGSGAGLTGLNASNITTGTLGIARFPTGGAWALSSNLDIDIGTLFINPASNLVGIGTAAPEGRLHVHEGSAGEVAAQSSSIAVFERSGQGFLSILTTDASERGILFGDPENLANGGIIYNNSANLDGLLFRTGGNVNRMAIDDQGNVGIGTMSPLYPLTVVSGDGSAIYGQTTAATGSAYGVWGRSASTSGRGVFGSATTQSGNAYGVFGESIGTSGGGVFGRSTANSGTTYGVYGSASTASSSFAVFASGNMGASGTKSFRIDHPDDPANKYLLHYSTESPEVLNAYSGTITLNGAGEAVVEMPHYFAKINKDPRYTLTAVGAPMPMLHVAEEIDEAALSTGAQSGPARPRPCAGSASQAAPPE